MISIQNLHFSYSKKKPLFEDLSIDIHKGKIYGLLGKNGTGKSSLLKLITGVNFPKSGQLTIDSISSAKRKPDILSEIFFLSEDYELPPVVSSTFIKAYSPFYEKFDANKCAEIMNIFEVPQEEKLSKLSFGQKKKFLIAFGIASNANYLLLDEPTNGLDIPSKTQFRKVMASGFNENQLVIISTHQIRDLSNLIESIIMIENGKIIFAKDVFEVEEKLLFTHSLTPSNTEDIIYSEMSTGGYLQISHNTHNEPTNVELEVLFNAVLEKRDFINQLF